MSVRNPRLPDLGRVAPAGEVHLAHRAIDLYQEMDRAYLESLVTITGDAADAWLNYRRIGEVRYAISRSARIAGYARLCAVRVDSAGTITREKSTGVEAAIVDSIYGRFGGTRGLIERYYTLMKVPAQAFLARVVEGEIEDGYWFLSASELPSQPDYETRRGADAGRIWRTRRAPGVGGSWDAFERPIKPEDFLGRIWAPDHEFVEDVNSPMQSLRGMCQQLHDLTESISGRLRQRFAMAGILLIPNEINDAAIQGDRPNDRKYHNDKVLNYLIHVMTTNVVNHAQGIAQIPILLKGPAAVLDKVQHVVMEATIAETDLKLRGELIDRILTALDQQKQAVTGGEGTNHWGMWAVSDEERRITVQPDLDAMCHALTRLILWPQLRAKGRTPGSIRPWRVWYDLSAASVRANMSEDARQLWDRGSVSDEYLRMVSGASENDKPSTEEYVRRVGWSMKNPILACYGLEGVDAVLEEAAMWGNVSGPAPDSSADPGEVGPGAGDPGSPSSRDSDTPKTQEPG